MLATVTFAPGQDAPVEATALGHDSPRRFAAGEPLRRVHEAFLATLALESDPIDPRL